MSEIKAIACPLCGDVRMTRGGMYIHLKLDHGLDHDEAFETAGEAGAPEVYPK